MDVRVLAGTRLEVQPLDELGRAKGLWQVVLVAQHQQRNARQARLCQQVVQLAASAHTGLSGTSAYTEEQCI